MGISHYNSDADRREREAWVRGYAASVEEERRARSAGNFAALCERARIDRPPPKAKRSKARPDAG